MPAVRIASRSDWQSGRHSWHFAFRTGKHEKPFEINGGWREWRESWREIRERGRQEREKSNEINGR
ncbi:MAG TPA: hypothetical protein VFR34_04370 [Paracoccaceae bacterium]|nr:hypothetical protein [Paracoccaceae bacterium]